MCETEKHSEIQSGQFMISKLDDSESEKEDVESLEDLETVTDHKTSGMPAFDGLQSLFKSLSLAYVETLTSPRWSHFKGTGFALKQKVRLNNIIWREYHMQYVKQLPPVIVKFQVPSCDETHNKAQCLVMEGKFWNRHSKKLSNEYRRWRTFFINHLRKKPTARSDKRRPDFEMSSDFPSKIQYLEEKDILNDVPSISGMGSPRFIDELMRDFDGSLDLFLDQPFPNPRDMSMLGNSDIMQPGLTQLQPNSENCRSDLIASLLQQPVMPTIAEDEYLSNNCQQVNYNTQGMFNACQQPVTPQYQTHYRPYNALPSSRQQVFCRGHVTGKQFHQQQQQPVVYNHQSSAQGKCLRFLPQPMEPQPPQQQPPHHLHEDRCHELSKSPDAPRTNLTLLNALLQKPKPSCVSASELRERHHSASSDTRFSVNSVHPRPLPPPATSALESTNSQFHRQLSSSSSSALIVDLSKDRISPIDPSPSVFLDDLSSGFTGVVDQTQPQDAPCDRVPPSCLPTLVKDSLAKTNHDGALFGYRQPIHNLGRVAPHRLPSSERLPSTASTAAAAAASVVSRPLPLYSNQRPTSNAVLHESQKLVSSHYRRGRSQFHPNQPYRRPPLVSQQQVSGVFPQAAPPVPSPPKPIDQQKCSSISSAPELYGICPVGEAVSLKTFPSTTSTEYSPCSNEAKLESSIEDYSPLADDGESAFIPDVEADDAVDDDCGEEADEDDTKAYSAASTSTGALSDSSSFSHAVVSTAPSKASNTEQRRRLSMQSSLKLLQELVQANQHQQPKQQDNSQKPSRGSCGSGRKADSLGTTGQPKASKAAILRDGAELIRSQRVIRAQLDAEIGRLRAELDSLQSSINACCDKLPVSGAVSKHQAKAMKSEAMSWYRHFVATVSQSNWKFYIFSLIFNDLFDSYCEKVCSTSTLDVLRRSIASWLEDCCDLPQLRKCTSPATSRTFA